MGVTALGYIGIEASDIAAWRRYASEFLGLMEVASVEDGLRFRIDARGWRIAVQPGPADDLAYAGYEVANEPALLEIVARLDSMGTATSLDPALAKRRSVAGLARCIDPAGVPIELYYGATERFESPLCSPVGVSGFVAGNQGVGHIVLFVADMAAALRFYMQGLGFRISDTIETSGPRPLELTFLHCNPRHHTLALVPAPVPKRLNHFMLQVGSLEDVGQALDHAATLSVPISATLGRHTNDHMVSFYARTPSGFDVEYGFGARTITDDWTVSRHEATSTWGHRRSGNHG